jgi:regulator of sigma E protease
MGILYFFVAVLVLAIMIAIHELGHYTAGRLLGFKILDYSIGFGPAIFKFRKNDITYALRAIPLGGACRFYGEEDDPQDVKDDPNAIPFNAQKPWKRLIVIFAGPFMNFVLAYLLAVIMMLGWGEQKVVSYDNGDYAVTIYDVAEGSAADKGGIEKGDVLISVGGHDLTGEPHSFDEKTALISKYITEHKEGPFSVTVLRGEETIELTLDDIFDPAEGKNRLGITMGLTQYNEPESFGRAFGSAAKFLVDIVKTTYEAIADGFKNGFAQETFTGIVGTVAITMKMASMGLYYVLLVMALISMSLGIMNLLPLLPLDGGHLLFDFIELIFGKPVPRKIQNACSLIGFGLLIALMIYVTIGDIRGIANGLFDF